MAYINKKDFSIIRLINDILTDKDDYFECDDLIAPAIALLNKKGYKTKFCCSGHPYPMIDSLITDEEINNTENILNIVDSKDMKDEILKVYGDNVDFEQFHTYVSYINRYKDTLYVAFEDKYEFPNLPKIFYYDINYNGIYELHTLDENGEYYISDTDETFDGMLLIADTNRIFYEYVKSLKSLV